MRAARSTDWKTVPLPELRTTVPLNRVYSAEEMERIRMGLVPQEMEDKWFVYWKDGSLYFHRSWTGYCVYVVRFTEETAGWRMVEADVNRDPGQYRETSDERDAEMIPFLVDVLLLRRPAVPPESGQPSQLAALSLWSLIGRAMLGQHPEAEDREDEEPPVNGGVPGDGE